jgi:multidrug efflux system outer membrane protein
MRRSDKVTLLLRTLGCVGLALVAGCAVGPDYTQPLVESPETYRAEVAPQDSILDLRWWELFDDPALDSLVIQALDHNRDLRMAASRIEEARAFYGFTKADLYPRIDIQAGASRGNYALGNKLSSIGENVFIAPVLSWEIDFWGKFRRANEAARADLVGTQFAHRTLQLSLISEVVSTYFELLDVTQRLEISERTLQSRLRSLDIIQKRFDHGIIPEIDLNQSQIQKEIAEGAIPVQRRLIARTEHTLSVLVGQLPRQIALGDSLYLEAPLPEIPTGIPSELLQRRPDILEAEFRLRAQTARIGVAQAQRFPSISLTGVLGLASNDLTSFSDSGAWSIGGGLFGPLLDFGKAKSNVEVERERMKQSVYNYENTVLLAFRDVEDALVDIATYDLQMEAVERKLVAARSAARLSSERYDKGAASYLEVLDSERTLFSVELELSELRSLFRNSYVRLYKSLGGGWMTREELQHAEAAAAVAHAAEAQAAAEGVTSDDQ